MDSPITITTRRVQILDAALDCFRTNGYQRTTIAQIRTKSGASTGSIYHLFAGKPAIAHALVSDAIAQWQLYSDMANHNGNSTKIKENEAKAAIKSSVTGLVTQGTKNHSLYQFMDEMRILADSDPDLVALKTTFASGQAAAKKFYRTAAKNGIVRDIPWPTAHALMLGPSYEYLRCLDPQTTKKKIAAAKSQLGRAAWRTVRAPRAK